MKKALLFLLLSYACASAQQYVPRSSSGGVDGQDIAPLSVRTGLVQMNGANIEVKREGGLVFTVGNGWVILNPGSYFQGRITQRVETLTDAATVTPNSDDFDGGILTELSQDSTIANPTGTPTDQQRYLLRIKSTTARALTWGSEYRGSTGIPLATETTGGGKTDYFVIIRDVADSKWDVMPNRGF